MLKILTYINFAAFILGIAGLGGAYLYRSKIIDVVQKEIEKEIPGLVKELMPALPKATGVSMPF
tara:strand:+ start:293 stop:484 length:192 start_codon:yes stop_codon:yes gene_type:complete